MYIQVNNPASLSIVVAADGDKLSDFTASVVSPSSDVETEAIIQRIDTGACYTLPTPFAYSYTYLVGMHVALLSLTTRQSPLFVYTQTEGLEQLARRHRIFCIPLYLLPPTKDFCLVFRFPILSCDCFFLVCNCDMPVVLEVDGVIWATRKIIITLCYSLN